MTEKRFTINSYSSYDTTTIKDNSSTRVLSVIDCVDELNYLNKVGNELYKKNEQLKSENKELKEGVEELNEICKYYEMRIKEFDSENQHIKNLITEAYANERTQLGRNVLKQLLDQME